MISRSEFDIVLWLFTIMFVLHISVYIYIHREPWQVACLFTLFLIYSLKTRKKTLIFIQLLTTLGSPLAFLMVALCLDCNFPSLKFSGSVSFRRRFSENNFLVFLYLKLSLSQLYWKLFHETNNYRLLVFWHFNGTFPHLLNSSYSLLIPSSCACTKTFINYFGS